MQSYVNQLLHDLRAAQQEAFFMQQELTHQVMSGRSPYAVQASWRIELSKPLSEWMGIERIVFPPHGRLNDAQISELVIEIKNLCYAYDVIPEFPDDLPNRQQYETLRKYWDEEVIRTEGEETEIEFCDYDTNNCPFGEQYCSCRKIEDEENYD